MTPPTKHAVGTLVAWMSLGLWQVWFSLGDDVPFYARPHLVDLVALTAVGAVTLALPSFPRLANPLWAVLLPVLAAMVGSLSAAPLHALVAAVGLVVTLGAAWQLSERWRMPAPAAVLAVPLSLLALDATLEEIPQTWARVQGPLHSRAGEAAPTGPTPASDRPSVVIVTVDTLRWDRVDSMASIQRLRDRGAWWERAASTSSWTLPALASIQTGLLPQDHGATCLEDGACQGLYDDVGTLAQTLGAEGWHTLAVVANPWADTTSGLTRGFRSYRDLGSSPPRRLLLSGYPIPTVHHQMGPVLVDAALADVATVPDDVPVMLWVHFADPHMPYTMQPDDDPLHRKPTIRDAMPGAEALAHVVEAYDTEVRSVDGQIGRLFDALEASGRLDGTVIVFAADHGEEFLEHGDLEHGHQHHTEVVDVPLLIAGPGVAPGRRDDLASLVDVTPTVLGLVGLPVPEGDGVDLRQPVAPDRIAVTHGNLTARIDCSARQGSRRAIIRGCHLDEPLSIETYDLAVDPGEHAPLPVDPADPLVEAARLDRPEPGTASRPDAAALRALGYVQ